MNCWGGFPAVGTELKAPDVDGPLAGSEEVLIRVVRSSSHPVEVLFMVEPQRCFNDDRCSGTIRGDEARDTSSVVQLQTARLHIGRRLKGITS
jgi:hypothetical protein